MKILLTILSIAGLALTIVPSFLVLAGKMELQTNFLLMAIGMVVWFVSAPFWMKNKSLDEVED
ncbi:MAG: hypothetical protein ACERKD_10495 [Prolixibacteraceae bacterium]